MKEILKAIINDLEKTAIALKVLESGKTGANAKIVGELALNEFGGYYESLRKKVDDLP